MSEHTQKTSTETNSGRRPNMGMRGGMGRGPMGMMKGEKPKDFRGTFRKLLATLAPYRLTLILVAIFALASTVFMIIGPKIMGEATTTLFEGIMARIGGQGDIDFPRIAALLLWTLGLYGVSALFSWVMGWVMTSLSTNLAYRFRRDINAKIHRLPLAFFDRTPHGEVLSRITNDVDTINQTLSQGLTQIVTSVATVLGVLAMMVSIDWRMTMVALVTIPLSLILVSLIVKKSQAHFATQQAALGEANAHIEEMFGGHLVIKAYGREAASVETFAGINRRLHASAWKSQFLSGLMMPLMTVVGNIGYVAVVVLGGWLAAHGTLTLGDVQAFIQYMRNFTQPLMQIANMSNIFQQTVAAAERVFSFLEEAEESSDPADTPSLPPVLGRVEFQDLNFGYDPAHPVIKHFSALAEPGKKVAIVGPTGAGKTTMVKLLMRFYDLGGGRITIDGTDIATLPRRELRRQFAMVLQDTWLYHGTVMENIRYGRPDASDEEVIAAAKAAHVDHFIHTWPEGYHMLINEESNNISQGQKQLLTIARAILADPPILILDEATSSVDTRTETLIQQAMDRLMHGRTSFVIAHRLSTIRNADLILVMRDGDIVEQGNHEALMAAGGFYRDLYQSQFEQVG